MGKRRHYKKQGYGPKDSRHHIIPSSRGGREIVWVNSGLHEKYHALFADRTPEEVVKFLVDYFFGGRYDVLENVLKEESSWKTKGT